MLSPYSTHMLYFSINAEFEIIEVCSPPCFSNLFVIVSLDLELPNPRTNLESLLLN